MESSRTSSTSAPTHTQRCARCLFRTCLRPRRENMCRPTGVYICLPDAYFSRGHRTGAADDSLTTLTPKVLSPPSPVSTFLSAAHQKTGPTADSWLETAH